MEAKRSAQELKWQLKVQKKAAFASKQTLNLINDDTFRMYVVYYPSFC